MLIYYQAVNTHYRITIVSPAVDIHIELELYRDNRVIGQRVCCTLYLNQCVKLRTEDDAPLKVH